MVTVIDAEFRISKEGKKFYVLLLQGDLEMVQSQETGRFYATTRRCTVSSTFDEKTAMLMIGKSMPGKIKRVPCEGYQYTIPETGEVISLAHRWEYVPEEKEFIGSYHQKMVHS